MRPCLEKEEKEKEDRREEKKEGRKKEINTGGKKEEEEEEEEATANTGYKVFVVGHFINFSHRIEQLCHGVIQDHP